MKLSGIYGYWREQGVPRRDRTREMIPYSITEPWTLHTWHRLETAGPETKDLRPTSTYGTGLTFPVYLTTIACWRGGSNTNRRKWQVLRRAIKITPCMRGVGKTEHVFRRKENRLRNGLAVGTSQPQFWNGHHRFPQRRKAKYSHRNENIGNDGREILTI